MYVRAQCSQPKRQTVVFANEHSINTKSITITHMNSPALFVQIYQILAKTNLGTNSIILCKLINSKPIEEQKNRKKKEANKQTS